MRGVTESDLPAESAAGPPAPVREVRHEYTLNWPRILAHINSSLLVSTYQAGKLVVVGLNSAGLSLAYRNFEKAMGLAVRPDRIAVGTRSQVWFLNSAPELAPKLEPENTYDACYLARKSHFTGEVQIHEMAWSGETLWFANTLFSCLATLDDRHSFVPRWRPRFISELAAEDRCHLNGLAMANGKPAYVTAMSETDRAQGWREHKATSGCLIDVASGETVVRGLSMPHSPRVEHGRVWLLDSGRGALVYVDLASGKTETVCLLEGYARGLAFAGPFAFVGLSRIRETSTFGGVPIAERRESLKCGVAVVELSSGQQVGLLEFHTGVEEIFDVKTIPSSLNPAVSGPHFDLDGVPPIWLAPRPG